MASLSLTYNWDVIFIPLRLENVFIKHYAPNHLHDPKGDWSLLENINGIKFRNSFVNLLMISNQQTKIQVPMSSTFQVNNAVNFQKAITPKKPSE